MGRFFKKKTLRINKAYDDYKVIFYVQLPETKWHTAEQKWLWDQHYWLHSQYYFRSTVSSGSSGWVRGARNMKSMRPPLAAIFFMTYFHRAGGAMAPSAPLPGSATDCCSQLCCCVGSTSTNYEIWDSDDMAVQRSLLHKFFKGHQILPE